MTADLATTLPQRVLRTHRRTLTQLGADHDRDRFRAALQLGVDALDRVDEALVGADAAAAARVLGDQRRILVEHQALDDRNGWDVTALAWGLFALERIDRALRGVTDAVHLGLPIDSRTAT